MGHHVQDDTGSRYLVPDFEDLQQKYYRNLDVLTIFNKVEVYEVTDERLVVMEDRIRELEQHLRDRDRVDKLP